MDLFRLDGKTALVTGGARGIGLAIVEAFREAGANVLLSSENETEVIAAALATGAEGFACDVADREAPRMMLEAAIARFGGVDILVCNAGVADGEGHERVMAVNLGAMVSLTELALPKMAARGGGCVILMASIAALRGNRGIHSYALAKAGVAQLARNLAVQWGPSGIRTNAIAPGLIDTGFARSLLDDEAFMARRMQMTPLRRAGTPQEVAGAALFLASAAGGFVNGHILVVDGGTVITDGG
ncbi:MAG TPA: SDR family oxidoreductase [Allosphingosinicella sp.]|nr:SDR family oxidoreductase [Allosphingosinicella sp.]